MKGDKLYRVRLKIKDSSSDLSDFIVAYIDDGKVIRITPSFAKGTDNSTLLFDLDATVAVTKLVVAPSEAVDAQIIAEINKGSGNFATVNFESTSILWIDYDYPDLGNGVYVAAPGTEHAEDEMGLNQRTTLDDVSPVIITKVGLDKNDQRLINVGAKISDINEYAFDEVKFGVNKSSNDKHKWLGLSLRVFDIFDNDNTSTMVSLESGDVIIDNGSSAHTQVERPVYKKVVNVWFKADQVGDTTFTLKYVNGNKTESLTLTIRLHDASDASIIKAEPIGDNAKGVRNIKIENGAVTFDTYKYAMDSSTNDDGNISRPYTLQFTTNVPVDSLEQLADGNNGNNKDDWSSIATKTGDNTFTLTLDANSDNTSTTLTLANKWGKYSSSNVPSVDTKKEIQIKPSEVSKTALKTDGEDAVSGNRLKTEDDLAALNLSGVTVEEPDIESDPNLKNNLKISASLRKNNSKIKTIYDENEDKLTSEIEVDSSAFDEIVVTSPNGTKTTGKWMLTTALVRGDIQNFDNNSNDESVAFVDSNDSGNLLTSTTATVSSNTWYVLPLWINLSSDEIKAVTSKNNTQVNGTYEIKFKSTSPVEEHNSLFIKIKDTNTMKELKEEDIDKVETTADPDDYINADNAKLNEFATDVMGWTAAGSAKKEDMQAIANNMQILENADKEINVQDDTIYMTLTGDWKSMKTDSGINGKGSISRSIPLSFDISMLNYSEGDVYNWCSKGSENKFYKDTNANNFLNKESADKTKWSTPLRFGENDKEWKDLKEKGKCTISLIITTDNMDSKNETKSSLSDALDYLRSNNGKNYVCYVVTFVQE